ncbi:hypothetical protein WJX81_003891 [Elliptochloris bilobata]|uniref:Amine oxidase domain-containing protein n=1 Tax=Elliptochloris bilobata TaxID=381761 RepID=A0AAW1SC46_9CHLO
MEGRYKHFAGAAAEAAFKAPDRFAMEHMEGDYGHFAGAAAQAAFKAPDRFAMEHLEGHYEHYAGAAAQVVIVGGGWAGFGAAKHLAEQGYAVTLLDAAPEPGGLASGFRTKDGRAYEAGIKGFWYEYHNIFALVRDLEIPWPFTTWSRSGFWGPRGLAIEAPVFSELPRLPTLLGQFWHTLPLFRNLSLADRATMLPLLYSIVDFDSSSETYERYDRMTARELFLQYGVSNALFEEFLKPLLLVGLFELPEHLSAAEMIGTLYFYTLAHQNNFDIAWCKGSVSERLFAPLVARIRAAGGEVLGGRLAVDVITGAGGAITGVVSRGCAGEQTLHEADAVILAISIAGMQKLVAAAPALAALPELRATAALRSIDCLATRLWLDRRVTCRFPANVLSGLMSLEGAGGTWFHLNDLQDEYVGAEGSVVAADFYRAGALLLLPDEEIVARVLRNLQFCEPGFLGAQVVDSAVLRAPRAVTHFSPGSHALRPTQETGLGNLWLAGDWVKGVPHGANGLSQERAYVTGLRAANLAIARLGHGSPAAILDIEPDEAHIAAAKALHRGVRRGLHAFGLS